MKLSVYKELCCLDGNKTSSCDFFIFILEFKKVSNYLFINSSQEESQKRRGFAAQSQCDPLVFTPPFVVLNSPFIQITALNHREKAPLCCNLMECFRVQGYWTSQARTQQSKTHNRDRLTCIFCWWKGQLNTYKLVISSYEKLLSFKSDPRGWKWAL